MTVHLLRSSFEHLESHLHEHQEVGLVLERRIEDSYPVLEVLDKLGVGTLLNEADALSDAGCES